jgi:hypothetical protein
MNTNFSLEKNSYTEYVLFLFWWVLYIVIRHFNANELWVMHMYIPLVLLMKYDNNKDYLHICIRSWYIYLSWNKTKIKYQLERAAPWSDKPRNAIE